MSVDSLTDAKASLSQLCLADGGRKEHRYEPNIITRDREPVEFSCFRLTEYVGSDDAAEATNSTGAAANGSDYTMQHFSSISAVLEQYYASRNVYTRIRQKSVDLRRIVATAYRPQPQKYQLQEKQLKDTEKRDKYKVYGELIHTYGYGLAEGAKELEALNYYTNEMIKITLDPMLDAKANAQKFFDKYNKLKRTYEALTDLTAETRAEIEHLEHRNLARYCTHGRRSRADQGRADGIRLYPQEAHRQEGQE